MAGTLVDAAEQENRLPLPGQIARLRQRLYLVEQVIPPPRPGDATLVKLSCVDDDAQGQPLEVLWEKEIGPEVQTSEAWEAIAQRGFDQPRLFAAYLNTLKWNCVTATDPKLFQSPFRAGIRIDAYQLEPLRKALLLPRVNLFIADDVGLGKTIEAGLIARELLLRKKVNEIIVSCPPSMLLQWQDELAQRFGLSFEILDKKYVSQVRRQRGFGINPWGTHTRFLISHRLLIDEAYTAPLLDWLGDFRPGTLFILDEAHHAAPASGQKYAIDSQITRAVRELARRFEHRLFLSATPHNGHSNSFSALLEILDPQRFCAGVPVKQKMLDDVMVRRLKDDLREIVDGIPKRNVVQLDIDGLPADAPELLLAKLLDDYRELREKRLSSESKRKQAAAGLLISGLQQRLLSSVEAFARTLRVHRRTVERQWEEFQAGQKAAPAPTAQLDLLGSGVGSDDDRADLSEEDLQEEEEAQISAASALTAGPMEDASAQQLFRREQKLLAEMSELADEGRGHPDARVRLLLEWMRERMCPALGQPQEKRQSANWTDLRIIIFTEYDDTKRYLVQQLSAATEGTNQASERIAVFHGPTSPADREDIKRAFNAPPSENALRILIATDAAREGLNLQAHCWNLFHFDVPWNPSRMEQRNGRIDRKLQPQPEVFCHYFVYRQRPEDRILKALVRKTDTIRRELGSLAQVIDSRLASSLKFGIRRADLDSLEAGITSANLDAESRATVDEELESARLRQTALLEQIQTLQTLKQNSQERIGLTEEDFRSAISSALQLLGAQPLQAKQDQAAGPPRFVFPAIDQQTGADSTWADTLDSLRQPRQRDQKHWEWRQESPIRPIVFEDMGTLDSSVVHLHLEHRVVQRLLSWFTSQGFVHFDLSRACLAQTKDSIPRVILLGRLAIYGPGAARLHEELISVTARWLEPATRKEPLVPYSREAELKTLDLLGDALVQPGRGVGETTQRRLQAFAPADVQQLLPHLTARGEQFAADARGRLAARAGAEAKAMLEILQTQKRHIAATIAKHSKDDPRQLKLVYEQEDELRQLEANKRYWNKRLLTLEDEIKSEPERIRLTYDIKATRIEPVGLVYLWPVTG